MKSTNLNKHAYLTFDSERLKHEKTYVINTHLMMVDHAVSHINRKLGRYT